MATSLNNLAALYDDQGQYAQAEPLYQRALEASERVLGHEQQGVEGIYDRHRYRDEKADALARFATLIDGIVNPSRKQACLRRGFPLPVGRR